MNSDKSTYESLVTSLRSISSVTLGDLSVSSAKRQSGGGPVKVNVNFQVGEFHVADGCLFVSPEFGVKAYVDTESEAEFSLSFTFRIQYHFDAIELFDKDMIELFVRSNTPINIWPYARELIGSLTTRMGYPALLIEPLKHIAG